MLLSLLVLLPLLWGGSRTQSLRIKLELKESVTVQEGLCVLVPCKFSYLRGSYGYRHMFWFRGGASIHQRLPVATNKPEQKVQERTQGRFFLLGDPWVNNCSLSIRDANVEDNGMYSFGMDSAYKRYLYGDKMFSLKVTALTQSPNIQIPGILESGHPRNLTCTVPWACEQGTPPIFSWNSAALTSLGPRAHLSSVLTLSPRPQDHGTSLTCQVTFPAVGVTVKRTIQLNISYAPQNMVITASQGNSTAFKILGNASSLPILEGQSLRLVCVADSNPPALLSWFWQSPSLNTSLISNTGYMELPQAGTAEGVFTCQAQNQLGSQHVLLNVFVHWKPEPRSCSEVLGAAGGASGMALLCLCLFLIFRVKTQRKKAASTMEGVNDTISVLGSGSWGQQHQFQIGIPSDHRGPAGPGPISREKQELHYASLNFKKLRLQEQEDTDTEYTEIKTYE
ncbi:sialic acid-binding Ig-like lectin 6 isoform X1 [Loxodonta africana]|uniref:sialic acid-binding Ig-like lectin 6 isoform X1 n=1 Tax=Loxodonta africana TaxID=9785 RepID=UPI0005404446|nr:sialic acid-binding Ig-like lectin 6 isoform X1 [Loxodonta africana]